jgi:hypothetical protein
MNALELTQPVQPQECDYKTIIHDRNVYLPQALLSMQ